MEFVNAAKIEFTDVSTEAWREYLFPGGDLVRIEEPLKLHVSESGGHRIFDASGLSHCISPSWIKITWHAKDGQPHFVL
ncbi:MAG: hypothetical protein V4701_01350 [Pseudomonadota bacterium]